MVDYNKKRLLDGSYKCDSESRAGFNKDVIDILAENTYLPLGIHYVRQFEYSGGNEGTNYPTVVRIFVRYQSRGLQTVQHSFFFRTRKQPTYFS